MPKLSPMSWIWCRHCPRNRDICDTLKPWQICVSFCRIVTLFKDPHFLFANGDDKVSKLYYRHWKLNSKFLFCAQFHVAQPFELSVGSLEAPLSLRFSQALGSLTPRLVWCSLALSIGCRNLFQMYMFFVFVFVFLLCICICSLNLPFGLWTRVLSDAV